MERSRNETVHHIFFLKLTAELPDAFFQFSELFSKWNVNILPVTPSEFSSLQKGNICHVICVQNDFESYFALQEFRKKSLDFAMLQKRVIFFHLSSFSPIDIEAKLRRIGNYHFLPLPISYEVAAKFIGRTYYSEQKLGLKWPGGRRPKPSLEN